MVAEQRERIKDLVDQRLPSLPGVALQLLALCDDHRAGARDVAEVASVDPALVARLLEVANSSFYALRSPATDVVRAATVLGLENLKLIGLSFAVLGGLWSKEDAGDTVTALIGASVMAAAASRNAAITRRTDRHEEAFAAGAMAYVGELVLARAVPEEFGALWRRHGGLPPAEAQVEAFDLTGAELGVQLVAKWELPDGLRAAVLERSTGLGALDDPDPYLGAVTQGVRTADSFLEPGDIVASLKIRLAPLGLNEKALVDHVSQFRAAVRDASRLLDVDNAVLDRLVADARQELLSAAIDREAELRAAQAEIAELRDQNERLITMARSDRLTGLPNRLAYDDFLAAHLYDHVRGDTPGRLGLVLFDLDGFKLLNDTAGHPAGDAALCSIATTIGPSIRVGELLARLGGDEFALVVPMTNDRELRKAANRLRKLVARVGGELGAPRRITASVGAALVGELTGDPGRDASRLFEAADQALYRAKAAGRNRCVMAPPG